MFIIIFLLGAGRCIAQPLTFQPRMLEGFYLDQKIPLKKGLNFFVITDRREFYKYFGKINKPDTPRFEFEDVIVMAMRPQNRQSFLSFAPDAMKAGNYIEVYCNAKHDKHKIPYTCYPIAVAAIPRYFSVTAINFYNNEKKKLYVSLPSK